MVKNSLKSLMDMFPWFFDKSSTSNFYKSQDVTNRRFQELANDLFKISQSFQLNKRLLIWKEQSVPYSYEINFVANFPNLKSVKIFKDDNVVYIEDFNSVDESSSFDYVYSYDTRNELSFVNANDESDSEELEISHEEQLLLDQLLFWRIDVDDEHFDVNVSGSFSHLKSVTLYKNDTVIYTNSYEDNQLVTPIEYSYRNLIVNEVDEDTDEGNSIVNDIFYVEIETYNYQGTITKYLPTIQPEYITASEFIMEVETYDEYHLIKGWPENDEPQGNVFDHDLSLDRMGKLNHIPRKEYIPIDTLGEYYTSEPPFNNRLTEDDYHYMHRMIEYNLRLHDTPAPVLEIWKLYGIPAVMLNRERYLLKWFDILRHPHHKETRTDPCTGQEYETLIVDEWTPEPWEHKDKWFDDKNRLGEYFYASANTVRPVKKQSVNFTFKFLNSLADDISDDYTVTILLNNEIVEENYTNKQWICQASLLDEFDDNNFTFIGKDKENNIIGTVEITIIVRGCNDADFYVRTSGNDNNDGTRNNPFKTLQKALDSVNGNLDLIAVIGEITIPNTCIVKENCTIIGCNNAKITNLSSARFFNVSQNKQLTVQDITFVEDDEPYSALVDTEIFTNENRLNEHETAILENVDYGVHINDVEQNLFIKDLQLNQTTGVLSWKEIPKSDLTRLSDFNGIVTNLNLTEEDGLTYVEHSTDETDTRLLNLPYLYLDDRKGLEGAVYRITDNETVLASDNVIYVNEYGSEIVYEPLDHDIDEYEYQYIAITKISSTNTKIVLGFTITHPLNGQKIICRTNDGIETILTYNGASNYQVNKSQNTSNITVSLERTIHEGIVYLGCEKIFNL